MHDKQLLEPTPDISRLAAVFANSARSALCSALMSGSSWTVGKLAAYAHIARSTASEHVTVLVEAGIAREYRQGRHRYVTISGPAVGDLIERLGALSAAHFGTPHSVNASRHTQRHCCADLLQALGGRVRGRSGPVAGCARLCRRGLPGYASRRPAHGAMGRGRCAVPDGAPLH